MIKMTKYVDFIDNLLSLFFIKLSIIKFLPY